MKKYLKKNYLPLVFFIISLGIFFRYYNLSWGAPYFFHPDERNIATSVSQLSFPQRLNPHFFAYGSLPIYTIYFFTVLLSLISEIGKETNILSVSFENSILIGRFFSFILSIGVLFMIYKITKICGGNRSGAIISICLASLSVGFIQYSHFATFEYWITFFTLVLCYSLLRFIDTKKYSYFLLSAVSLGILMSIKISSLIYIPLGGFLIILPEIINFSFKKRVVLQVEKIGLRTLVFIGIALLLMNVTSPFFWIDNSAFRASIDYESKVALGTLPVFYTQIFTNTVSPFFQIIKVFPFLLNPAVMLLGIISFIYLLYTSIKKRSMPIAILLVFFLVTLCSQFPLFVKWTRYYIPTIPFVYIFIGILIKIIIDKYRKTGTVISILLIAISLIYSILYFIVVLANQDSRIDASSWATKNIPQNSRILSEVYDLGIVPFNSSFKSITLFNFYDLDLDNSKKYELAQLVKTTDYIIVPSQRVISSRINNSKLYPIGHTFYSDLLSNTSGFKKVYQTECGILCKILYFGDPINNVEQTANIFDRPSVLIFKNEK